MTEILTKTIKAVSKGRLQEGSIGFMPEDEEKWYNITGEPEVLTELMKNVVARGNIIEFEFNNNVVGSLKLIKKGESKSGFDDLTNFEELLNDAHKKFPNGLSIKTKLISLDYEKKQAIFNASVSLELENVVYTAHGDAEGISNENIKPHFIRMAETRAIARALRWATNNAKASYEEK